MWIPAHVLRLREDGLLDLDVKTGAKVANIRYKPLI